MIELSRHFENAVAAYDSDETPIAIRVSVDRIQLGRSCMSVPVIASDEGAWHVARRRSATPRCARHRPVTCIYREGPMTAHRLFRRLGRGHKTWEIDASRRCHQISSLCNRLAAQHNGSAREKRAETHVRRRTCDRTTRSRWVIVHSLKFAREGLQILIQNP